MNEPGFNSEDLQLFWLLLAGPLGAGVKREGLFAPTREGSGDRGSSARQGWFSALRTAQGS